MAKTFALAKVLYEDEEMTDLPFVHSADDIVTLKEEERKLQKDLTLVSFFGDMEGLGLEMGGSDLIPDSQIKNHLE